MKIRNLAVILGVTAFVLTGCAASQTEVKHVGTEVAKAEAVKAAGLESNEVVFDAANLNERNGQSYYGVDFTFNGEKYSCDIDALTGKLINFRGPEVGEAAVAEEPVKAEEPANTNESVKTEEPAGSEKALIGEEKAKEIAIEHAGVKKSDTVFVKSGLDRDDGRQVYDVEFYTKDFKEYDYDIDAYTGEIFSFDHDAEYYAPKVEKKETPKSENSITEAQAKKIALDQVPGAAESDIWEFETDYDDGRLGYEGKIYYNHMEYEFEIDGYSGAIRNWEVESIYD